MSGNRPPRTASPTGRRSARVRRSGRLLFVVAVSLMAGGVATGHGLVLAAGLALAPFGLNLISGRRVPRREVPTIHPTHVVDAGGPGRAPACQPSARRLEWHGGKGSRRDHVGARSIPRRRDRRGRAPYFGDRPARRGVL